MSDGRVTLVNLSRREFVVGAGGLVIGCLLPTGSARAVSKRPGRNSATQAKPSKPELSDFGSWIRIALDSEVTVVVEQSEMGQGIHSALAMLVAEELEVNWENVRVEPRPLTGPLRNVATGVSSSIRNNWGPLREAGAAAREMLRASAAAQWNVSVERCVAKNGTIQHPASGRTARYGDLAGDASVREVPASVALKKPEAFRIVGTPAPRKDIPEKVTGAAIFGIDVQVDGMLYGAPVLCPYPGGRIESADFEKALSQPGVSAIAEIPNGIAVIADHYWQARKGVDALAAKFTGNLELNSDDYSRELLAALDSSGVLVHQQGEPQRANDPKLVEARYEVPFLAHATMEPMNCTASSTGGACEIWAPTQTPSRVREKVAEALNIDPLNVTVHTTLMGGGFGRRNETDDAIQAALASREAGRPVKIIWTREDDTRNDFYRPACAAQLSATVDDDGLPIAVTHHVAGPWNGPRTMPAWFRRSVGWAEKKLGGPLVPNATPDAIKRRLPKLLRRGWVNIVNGDAPPLHYAVASQRLEYSLVDCELRLGSWRSVSASQNAFFVESFIDELAHAARQDPYEYRAGLLRGRELAVLERAAEIAGWGRELPPDTGQGIAFFHLFGTSVCQVVEVTTKGDELPRIERVSCALDCGQVVNPDTVRAQMEGSIIFGLTAALEGKITLEAGRVRESNFHDYPLLDIGQVPAIDVSIIESTRKPGGIGEPGTPPIAPALTNAIFAATGRRIRKLPLRESFPQQRGTASADGLRRSQSS